MADFKQNHGSVSAGTDFSVVEGAKPETCCTDNAPKGEQVAKGPGQGISGNGKRIR